MYKNERFGCKISQCRLLRVLDKKNYNIFPFIARAVQFGDLLPIEEDLDNYNNIFSQPRGLNNNNNKYIFPPPRGLNNNNNNNNILPKPERKQFQYLNEHEHEAVNAGGIKNILIDNSAPKRYLYIFFTLDSPIPDTKSASSLLL